MHGTVSHTPYLLSSHQAPSASTRLIRLEGSALTMARFLVDLADSGCRPQVTGIPQPDNRIAFLIWCSTPGDIVPIIRLATHTYGLRPVFGPLGSLPEADQPAADLVTGKCLWRWLCKAVQR